MVHREGLNCSRTSVLGYFSLFNCPESFYTTELKVSVVWLMHSKSVDCDCTAVFGMDVTDNHSLEYVNKLYYMQLMYKRRATFMLYAQKNLFATTITMFVP